MPAILHPGVESDWLDPPISNEHALALLEPHPASAIVAGPPRRA
jgi:putative SOS response-associated peptidase YedK